MIVMILTDEHIGIMIRDWTGQKPVVEETLQEMKNVNDSLETCSPYEIQETVFEWKHKVNKILNPYLNQYRLHLANSLNNEEFLEAAHLSEDTIHKLQVIVTEATELYEKIKEQKKIMVGCAQRNRIRVKANPILIDRETFKNRFLDIVEKTGR